jgi:glutathione synthase/RimK-type ligase-like ATP-grasp enzyme
MRQPAMLQPFLPQIASEGEISFLFVDGQFSHALIKRPASGDYRVQSLYGGTEEAITPSSSDLASAQAVVDAIPFETPLYARIDMVRGEDGTLLLMEAELIEPYLYPLQGPQLGERLAKGVMERLG